MLNKNTRFSRASFPTGRAKVRHQFTWGSVSLFGADTFHASVVVSKKVLKKAHHRNRARRRMYAVLAKVSPPPNAAVIIYPRSEALTANFDVVVKDVQGIFK